MQLDNRTPFAADSAWLRDLDGAEVWIVAVKCTFDVAPDGSMSVADHQPPVLRLPEYIGEPGRSSLRYDSDLVLAKTTTDILLLGHAYVPPGRPAAALEVGLRVGEMRKILRVHGERKWQNGGISPAELFTTMPLIYERAFGGADAVSADAQAAWDWRNPVGTGFAVRKANLDGARLPNIEYPGQLIQSWNDRPMPAGFGPVPGHWQWRARFAGTYDENWAQKRQPLPPDDFDLRFFQVAPPDQQSTGFLSGGESVAMRNLTPGGALDFRLPRIFLGFETSFYSGPPEHHRASLHTVLLEPDFPRVSLVFQTALRCHARAHQLQLTTIVQKRYVLQGDAQTEEEEVVW